MLVTSICPAPSFATASTISHFLLEMYILVLYILYIIFRNSPDQRFELGQDNDIRVNTSYLQVINEHFKIIHQMIIIFVR